MNPRSVDEFLEINTYLSRSNSTVTIVAMDIVGYGESSDPLKAPTIPCIAKHAMELLDSLKIGRVHVLGSMLGSIVAVEMAASAPQRVAARCLRLKGLSSLKRRGGSSQTDPTSRQPGCQGLGMHLLSMNVSQWMTSVQPR